MSLALYAHPFSSYCWKVLIAFRESGAAFDYRRLDDPAHRAEWKRLWPLKRMPLLVDGSAVVQEATIIIEYFDLRSAGQVRMIPADPIKALEVRKLDRISDNYLMTPTQTIVFDRAREVKDRDAASVKQAREMLDTAYAWWDNYLAGRGWAVDAFSLVECATAPALFYADWVHPIPDKFEALRRYRERLLARPSVAHVVDEARPFRSLFPFGDPGRD
jgi:glutathione S-transferase